MPTASQAKPILGRILSARMDTVVLREKCPPATRTVQIRLCRVLTHPGLGQCNRTTQISHRNTCSIVLREATMP